MHFPEFTLLMCTQRSFGGLEGKGVNAGQGILPVNYPNLITVFARDLIQDWGKSETERTLKIGKFHHSNGGVRISTGRGGTVVDREAIRMKFHLDLALFV